MDSGAQRLGESEGHAVSTIQQFDTPRGNRRGGCGGRTKNPVEKARWRGRCALRGWRGESIERHPLAPCFSAAFRFLLRRGNVDTRLTTIHTRTYTHVCTLSFSLSLSLSLSFFLTLQPQSQSAFSGALRPLRLITKPAESAGLSGTSTRPRRRRRKHPHRGQGRN